MIDTVEYNVRLFGKFYDFFPVSEGIAVKPLDRRVPYIMELGVFYCTINFFLSNIFDGVHELSVHVVIIYNIVVNDEYFFNTEPEQCNHDDGS